MPAHPLLRRLTAPALILLVCSLLLIGFSNGNTPSAHAASLSANAAFTQAANETGVPVALLKGICYFEGRLSMHGGSPSTDNGYGCMHLVKNRHANTLDQAAGLLHVSTGQVEHDLSTNIRGGAAVLRAEELKLSGALPSNLGGWYGEVANYGHVTLHATALSYANALFKVLNTGFNAQADSGELVTLAPQAVKPQTATANAVNTAATLPGGCSNTPTGDYPAAVNCILDPNTFDCTLATTAFPPCNYEERTDAGYPLPVDYVVIHDTEETLQGTLDIFQNTDPKTAHGSSANYVVDTDGTVYQLVHDADFTYNVGNYWYNQHSMAVEHVGFDATGFQWYNAAEYLGSAQLVAYLLKKFNLPLDRAHVVAHGTVPPPIYTLGPNHVDPGPYWMWDYYFDLIHQQGVAYPSLGHASKTIELHTQKHLSQGGVEAPADFNFYYLYNGPSTQSGLIPHYSGNGTDVTDETDNVETGISYYYLQKVKDPAGTGDTMYEIWYGEDDQVQSNPSSQFQDGKLAWLAVPPGTDVTEGSGSIFSLNQSGVSQVFVYGNPISGHILGGAPNGATFVSSYTIVQDNSTTVWYEINFAHRQAFVPASDVTVIHTAPQG